MAAKRLLTICVHSLAEPDLVSVASPFEGYDPCVVPMPFVGRDNPARRLSDGTNPVGAVCIPDAPHPSAFWRLACGQWPYSTEGRWAAPLQIPPHHKKDTAAAVSFYR